MCLNLVTYVHLPHSHMTPQHRIQPDHIALQASDSWPIDKSTKRFTCTTSDLVLHLTPAVVHTVPSLSMFSNGAKKGLQFFEKDILFTDSSTVDRRQAERFAEGRHQWERDGGRWTDRYVTSQTKRQERERERQTLTHRHRAHPEAQRQLVSPLVPDLVSHQVQ